MGCHRETWALKSKGFRSWLARRFYQLEERTPATQALQNAIGVLEGKAQYEGPVLRVHTRVAMRDGKIYVDLANERWEAIEITSDGWGILAKAPVKFRRTRGLLALPIPEPGGDVAELRRFINLPEGHETAWRLLVAWLLAAMRPSGPYPVLILHGETGTAKSTTTRVLRALIDPSMTALRTEPRDVRDLMIAAKNSWIIALDNLSHLQPWLSDALCRLSTGGGLSTRELYSDDDEILFEAQQPVILNGIEEVAAREDLLDRAIILYLPHIPNTKRRPESEFWCDFEAARPRILGALLTAAAAGLKNLPATRPPLLPRMADFATWAIAIEPALGWPDGAFSDAYTEGLNAANALVLESTPIAPAILSLAEDQKTWMGSASDLLKVLTDRVDEATTKQRAWPTSGRALSNILRRLGPNLRSAGVRVTSLPRQGRVRPILLEWIGTQASSSSPASLGDAASDASDATSPRESRDPPADIGGLFE